MVVGDGGAEGFAAYVGVYLGGGDAGVAKHFLDCSEVGSVFHQLGGKTVAKGMGADFLAQGCGIGGSLEEDEYHLTCEVGATPAEKDIAFFARFDLHMRTYGVNIG